MALNLNTDKFKLVGGALSLDFVNTVAGRKSNPGKKNNRDYLDAGRSDKMESYKDLLAWSVSAGLIEESEVGVFLRLSENDSQETEKIFKRALSLRDSVYRIFKSVLEGWPPESEDLEALNRELTVARQHQRLEATEKGFEMKWTDRESSIDAMIWAISESAAETLLSADLSRLRQCAGDDCGWLFLDTSRNRSRQWCDMKDCGNIAKVRRFRQRQQEQ